MLTPTQLRTATTAELETLASSIDRELTRRELLSKLDEGEASGRTVVEERQSSAGTLRLEHVKCGKARCKKCAEHGEGHGPYWYLYRRKNGKVTSRYLGKMVPDELQVSAQGVS